MAALLRGSGMFLLDLYFPLVYISFTSDSSDICQGQYF